MEATTRGSDTDRKKKNRPRHLASIVIAA